MNKLDLTKKVITRDGHPVTIKFTDGRGDYPIGGYIEDGQVIITWTLNGEFIIGCVDDDDLINAPEWKLPDPPEGYEWHRTDWTEEMLPDGWRPLLLDEEHQVDDEYLVGSWKKCESYGQPSRPHHCHRRTQRPLPPPKPKLQEVELCADDIKAGDEFLPPDGKRRQWQRMNDDCISFVWVSASWRELKDDGWKIRSIGETEWRKCSKMQEVTA